MITNYRILSLKQIQGTTVLSSVFLENVTAASVGRVRPNWKLILLLCLVAAALLFFGRLFFGLNRWAAADKSYRDEDDDRGPAIAMIIFGVASFLLAVWIFYARDNAVNFMVQAADSADNNLFSLAQSSRGNAIDMVHHYFPLKLAQRMQGYSPASAPAMVPPEMLNAHGMMQNQ